MKNQIHLKALKLIVKLWHESVYQPLSQDVWKNGWLKRKIVAVLLMQAVGSSPITSYYLPKCHRAIQGVGKDNRILRSNHTYTPNELTSNQIASVNTE